MGLVLSSISNALYYGEKFAACVMVTSVIWCLIGTLVITLSLGIGLGYNYCFVDMKTKFKYMAPRVRYPPPRLIDGRYPRIRNEENERDNPYRYPQTTSNPYPYESPRYGGYPYPNEDSYDYPGSQPVRIIKEEEEATLPNLSGDNPVNITSTVSTASDTLNKTQKTASLPLKEPATTTDDTLININSRPAVNTTKLSESTEDITTVKESTEKVDIEEGLPKMAIPITGLDLIGLLSRLRAENKNYTLQIVT